MRFVFTKDIRDNIYLKNVLWWLLLFLFAAIPAEIVVFFLTFGWSPTEITQSITGNPEAFTEGMGVEGVVSYIHTFLFFKLTTLVTVFAFFHRTPASQKLKIISLNVCFLSCILTSASLAVIPFLTGTLFSIFSLVFFLIGEFYLVSVIGYGIWFLSTAPKVPGIKIRY